MSSKDNKGDTNIQRGKEEINKDTSGLLNGDITFENVSFSYPNTNNVVLKNINVTIKAGEKIAIVGENGSGNQLL